MNQYWNIQPFDAMRHLWDNEEATANMVDKETKCPACDNHFTHSIDESGSICTPEKCISTGKPIPEETLRLVRREQFVKGNV